MPISNELLNVIFAGLTMVLMIIGIVGTIFPRVPGLSLIWSSVVIFSIATRFSLITIEILIIITALIALEVLLDFASSLHGTHRFEINFWGVIGALAGVFIASAFRSVPLLILLPLSGVIVGQLMTGHDSAYRMETPGYTLIGYVGGTIIKLVIGLGIVGLFIARVMSQAVSLGVTF